MRKISDSVETKAISDYKKGRLIKDICNKCNISLTTFGRILDRNNIKKDRFGYFEKGNVPFNKGKKLSSNHKVHLREARQRMLHDPIKYRRWAKRQRQSQLGKTISVETRQKISKANKGRKISAETKRKISEANKGRKPSKESIEKMRKSKIGVKPSLETRKKMSESQKARFKTPGYKEKWIRLNKSVFNEIRKKRKGKTFEEIFGKERAKEIHIKMVESQMRSWQEGRINWCEGKKLSKEHRKKLRECRKRFFEQGGEVIQKGKTLEEVYGEKRAKEIKKKFSLIHKGQSAWNKGKKTPEEIVEKLRESHLIHGFGRYPYPSLFSPRFKKKIRAIFQDKCFICNSKKGIHIHHINYNKFDCSIDNLIALCQSCHLKTNGNRDFWFAYFCYALKIDPEELVK